MSGHRVSGHQNPVHGSDVMNKKERHIIGNISHRSSEKCQISSLAATNKQVSKYFTQPVQK